ncbi:hypothetical protein PCASD_13652 [Puccinia coronata f. sp. avenae]|uniref:DNA (cytosine-5-)-methyltransferase n=1 Tax=Puccinia coronata f. sp. avenae TaxID=200324 RepID=A0A2N5U0S3_9BASI|nr:hypothetical protein PCASD_13652 [Puccinia coronata f. sp. avenae]
MDAISPSTSTTATSTTKTIPTSATSVSPASASASAPDQAQYRKRKPTSTPTVVIPHVEGLPPCPAHLKKKIRKNRIPDIRHQHSHPAQPNEPAHDPDFVPHPSDVEDDDVQSEEENQRRRYTGPQDPTVVLPSIQKRFRKYFKCLKPVSNPTVDLHQDSRPTPAHSIRFGHHHSHHDILWTTSRPWRVSQHGEDFYQEVKIQNHVIKIDSVVSCQRKTGLEFSYRKSRLTVVDDHYGSDTEEEEEEELYDEELEHNKPTQNQPQSKKVTRPNLRRFLVRALFERDRIKYFHGTWLEEARHSFVGESAEPLELLLVDQCYEIELKHVVGIETVIWIPSSTAVPPPCNRFYCRFHWKPTKASFADLPSVRKPNPPNPINNSTSLCSTCVAVPKEIQWLTDPMNGHIYLGKTDQYESLGFTLRGEETYRLHDFVRVADSSPSNPQVIGQIVEICGIRANPNANKTIIIDDAPFCPPAEVYSKIASLKHKPVITIRKYKRHPWDGVSTRTRKFMDDRQLWITDDEQLVDVKTQLQGKCEIIHLTKHQNNQYLTVGSGRKVSEQSITERDHCFYSLLPNQRQQKYICTVPVLDDSWKAALTSREPAWVKIEDESIEDQYKELVKNYGCGKIRHLELFGGIGSMSVALVELGLACQDDITFIDSSVPACQTISSNFPRSTVICADVNEVFELMITGKNEVGQGYLVDRRTGKTIRAHELPRPGDFDLVTAGFPCGSHSTLNVLRKANDAKNALCATALSFIAYLKPDYLFFENVRGLLKTSFINPGDDSVLNKAFLRIICGTLVSLGYQVNFGVLQAAQFGSPQARRRIMFSGTRHGLTPVKLPEPTHHFPDESLAILLPTNDESRESNKSVRADYRKCSSGSLPAITIHDSISDLPKFEYVNPNRVMGKQRATSSNQIVNTEDVYDSDQESGQDGAELIPQLNSLVSFSPILGQSKISLIGFDEFEYMGKPMNRYQVWLRKQLEWKPIVETFIPKPSRHASDHNDESSGLDCRIRNWHVTPRFSPKVTERICYIPMKPNADHRHLPKPLRLKNLKRCRNLRDFDGNYGRLGFKNQFNTIITKMHPHNQNKCGAVLHPNQNRTLSLLEAQRAQGFPDRFKLEPAATKGQMEETVNQQLFKLVGNTIPIPISLSLSKQLLQAREHDYMKSKKRLESMPQRTSTATTISRSSSAVTERNAGRDHRTSSLSGHEAHRHLDHHRRIIPNRDGPLNHDASPLSRPNSNSVGQIELRKTCVDCLDLIDLCLDLSPLPNSSSS